MFSLATLPPFNPTVAGLSVSEQETLNRLVAQWQQKQSRNAYRRAYVDMKQKVGFLGVSIPDYLKQQLEIVVGWPDKAVTAINQRCMWDGVVSDSSSADPFELGTVLDRNRFDLEVQQATEAAFTYSTSFWSVSPGFWGDGVPLLRPHSAEWATALWDYGRREISAGLAIIQSNMTYGPTEFVMFMPGETITCVKGSRGWAVVDRNRVPFDAPAFEVMPASPTLERPFGRSRVSRQVMSITDRAVRAALRMDVSSEFYMAPTLILLGVDESVFMDSAGNTIPVWDWMQGRVKAIIADEGGNLPQVQQVSQQSMQPYVDQMRELAAEFAGATSIPISSLGIVQDNPASAEAIYAAKEDLVIAATNANRTFKYSLNRLMQKTVMLRDGLSEIPSELLSVSNKFRNPAMPSVVSQSDAMVKQIAAIPWLAESRVALEELGYDDEQIVRLLGDKRRLEGRGLVDALLADQTPTPDVEVDVGADDVLVVD